MVFQASWWRYTTPKSVLKVEHDMARRWCTFLLGAGILLSAADFCPSLAAERPNFVIFLADDLGWGDLACYGNKVIQTPNLDRFASQGLRLTQCYSACSVCSPS